MHTAVLSPLADVPIPAHIAALPKAERNAVLARAAAPAPSTAISLEP